MGMRRFKKRKQRAELKLARAAIEVERSRDVEAEVKKRLRPLALQATAAERAEKLRGEIASLRARVAELDLAELQQRLEDGEGRRTAAVLARRHADEKLDSLLEERRRAELERALAEREGLPPAARALAEEGERLALSLLDVEPGTERAVAAALGHRAAAIVADDARAALALAERARAAGLGSVVVLTREPASLVRELPVVSQ